DRPILYGCGDFLDDYEGISRHEEFRKDLRLIYLLQIDPQSGRLAELSLVPLRARRFRLNRAVEADARWFGNLLSRLSVPFGTRVDVEADNRLTLHWQMSDVVAR